MCTGHDDTAGREEVARLSRRGFLRTTVTTAAVVGTSGALAGPAFAQEGTAGPQGHSRHRVPPDQISIQLYTLRDQLAIDLEGTLAALRAIGYTRVEHAGFVGRTVEEFKAALDAAGLRSSSGHVLIPQPFDPAAWSASLADANTLGSRYIVHPFFGIDFATGEVTRTTAAWRAFARDLNRAGRMARDAGLKLGYHNHNWEFFRLTDNPPRPPTTSSPRSPTRTWSTWNWICSGPPGERATRSTSSSRTRAGSCSTTSRT
jgi:Xylose isomerase-like TIM barrel